MQISAIYNLMFQTLFQIGIPFPFWAVLILSSKLMLCVSGYGVGVLETILAIEIAK